MKILAVNISKQISKKDSKRATEEAWKLNEKKFKKNLPEFVIGVASGKILSYYKFLAESHDEETNRVIFSLSECDKNDKAKIESFTKDKNLKYFVLKQKW
jgi:hypothetical protein